MEEQSDQSAAVESLKSELDFAKRETEMKQVLVDQLKNEIEKQAAEVVAAKEKEF